MKEKLLYKTAYAFIKAILILALFAGCQPDDDNLQLATFPDIAEVFTDVPVNLTDQFFVSFDPAAGANTRGFGTDNSEAFEGTTSIRIDVPAPNDPDGNFIGGIFLDRGEGRNLTAYNTFSFYAFSTTTATIDVGFGTDFETNSFAVSTQINLTTGWNQYFIPIPNAARLVQERGMFLFAAGTASTNGFGYSFWLDELRFEQTSLVEQNLSIVFNGQDRVAAATPGSTIAVTDLFVDYNVTSSLTGNTQFVSIAANPSYFDFSSSDEGVATVDDLGVIRILSNQGTTLITASLNGEAAIGSLTITEVDAGNNVNDSNNSQLMLPIGFESASLDYDPIEFGGAPSLIVSNPSLGSTNGSNNVLQTQKVIGSETFAGIFMDLQVSVDFSDGAQVSALVFSPSANIEVLLAFEDGAIGQASQAVATARTTVANQWQELIFDYSGTINNSVDYNRLVLIYDNGTPGDNSLYFLDDVQQIEGSVGGGNTGGGNMGGGSTGTEGNLLTNGDFEMGMESWFGNAFNVQTENDNSFNFSDNELAANAFDVNLSHPVALEAGVSYALSFDAATSEEDDMRTIVAGIGLNEGSFEADIQTVSINADLQTYTLTLSPPVGSDNSRVLFDLGADDGVLVVDNVTLVQN